MSIFNSCKLSIRTVSLLTTVLLASLVVLASGCADDTNGASFNITGTVTYQGKPVPTGYIKFIPKAGGATGFARINNGKYSTASGAKKRGVEAGDYTITVDGFDGVSVVDPDDPEQELGAGKQVVTRYMIEKSFLAEDQVLDIDVPKE